LGEVTGRKAMNKESEPAKKKYILHLDEAQVELSPDGLVTKSYKTLQEEKDDKAAVEVLQNLKHSLKKLCGALEYATSQPEWPEGAASESEVLQLIENTNAQIIKMSSMISERNAFQDKLHALNVEIANCREKIRDITSRS
jgi:hypothetical protein